MRLGIYSGVKKLVINYYFWVIFFYLSLDLGKPMALNRRTLLGKPNLRLT